MALGKEISDLLHLERAFERNRKVELPAEEEKAFAAAFTQCPKRIRSFAALADRETQGLRSHGRVAVAKLTREINFSRDVRQPLDQIFADSGGVQRGATAGENDPPYIAQFRRGHVQAA